MNKNIRKLTYSAMALALCYVLPFVTGSIPAVGNMLSPMHLPVMILGFLCGWPYGVAVGFIAPILRSLTLSMPPIMPTALSMAFELAVYGAVCGILYKVFPKKLGWLYLELAIAMLCGRIVGGCATWILMGIQGKGYSLAAFFTAFFVNAWPAILIQFILIPPIIEALRRAKLVLND